jgi:hypothetical protein
MMFAALGVAQASATVLDKKPTINTYKNWDGSERVASFGCPNTTTYGQVITIPATYTHLNKFTFSWTNLGGSGSMKVRADVYAWDGSKATGSALFETRPRFVSFSDALFHFETFKTTGVPVTAGQQYVIFASIDKDFEKCKNNYELAWALVGDNYAGGNFVFQNNGGDESQWTASAWSTFSNDLAFKAYLS